MPKWRATLFRTILGLVFMVSGSASASESLLCAKLVTLDRLPGHARRLLDPGVSTAARKHYLSDIRDVSVWLGNDAADMITARNQAAITRTMTIHRHIFDLIDAGNFTAAGALVRSRDLRHIDTWVEAELRAHHCAEPADVDHAKADADLDRLATVPDTASRPSENSAPSASRAATAAPHLEIPAALIWGLLFLLIGLAAVMAGARIYLDRRGAARFSCYISGAMRGPLYCEPTEIFDLSETGCKLRLHDGIDLEKPLTVFFDTWSLSAKSIWSNRHYAGLRFDRRLTPDQLRGILQKSRMNAETDGPPIPSLPCHSPICRETCVEHRQLREGRAKLSSLGP
jgi:hypothetical protein